jgi:hypothetical protein
MAKTRNILKNLSIEQAVGKRRCYTNSKHTIESGEYHLAQEIVPGQRENICVECAGKVFDAAEKYLAALRSQLGV